MKNSLTVMTLYFVSFCKLQKEKGKGEQNMIY